MSVRQKLKSSAGFTLAEALVAMLILLMVSSIVAVGIPVASQAYEKVTLAGNAQVLLSTTAASLRDELCTAREIEVADDETTLSYMSAETGDRSELSVSDGEGIMIQEYVSSVGMTGAPVMRRLISSQTATSHLYISYEKVTYNKAQGLVTFENLKVFKSGSDHEIAGLDSLSVRVMS